jgi:TP901 family phage tail tape measure protein
MGFEYQDNYTVNFRTRGAVDGARSLSRAFDALNQAIGRFNPQNVNNVNQALQGLGTSFNTTGAVNSINTLNSRLLALISNMRIASQHMRSFQQFGRSVALGGGGGGNAPQQVSAALTGQAQAANQAAQAQNNVVVATNNANRALRQNRAQVQQASNQMRQFGQHTKTAAEEYVVSWSSVFRFFQANLMTRAVWEFSGTLQQATQEAIKLSKAVGEVQTISQNVTGTAPIRSARAILADTRRVSDTFNLKQADVIAAQYEAVSNQVRGAASSFQFLEAAAKFSKVAQTDVAHSVDLLSSAINSFGFETSRTEDLAAKFFKAIEVGRFRAEDIANDFGRSAVLARQLGISFEELLSAFATTTIQGVKFANAQTFINNIMLKLVKPTDAMKDTLKELGVESGQALIKTYGFLGAIRELNQVALASLDPFGELAEMFGTIRAITGATTFIDDDTIRQYKKNLAKLQDANTSYATAFQTVMTNPGEQVERELNKVRNVLITNIGQEVLDMLKDWNEEGEKLADQFKKYLAVFVGLGGALLALQLGKVSFRLISEGLGVLTGRTITGTQATIANTAALTANTRAVQANAAARAGQQQVLGWGGNLMSIPQKPQPAYWSGSGAAPPAHLQGGRLARFGAAARGVTLGSSLKAVGTVIPGVAAAAASLALTWLTLRGTMAIMTAQTYKTAEGFSSLAERERELAEASIKLNTNYHDRLATGAMNVIDELTQAKNQAYSAERRLVQGQARAIENQIVSIEEAFNNANDRYETELAVQDRAQKRFKLSVESVTEAYEAQGKTFRSNVRQAITDYEKMARLQSQGKFAGPLPTGQLFNYVNQQLGLSAARMSQVSAEALSRDVPAVQNTLNRLREQGMTPEQLAPFQQALRGYTVDVTRLNQAYANLIANFQQGFLSPEETLAEQQEIERQWKEFSDDLVRQSERASAELRDTSAGIKAYGDEVARMQEMMDDLMRESDKNFSDPSVQRKIETIRNRAAQRIQNLQDLTGADPKPVFVEALRISLTELGEEFDKLEKQKQQLLKGGFDPRGAEIDAINKRQAAINARGIQTEQTLNAALNNAVTTQQFLLALMDDYIETQGKETKIRQESEATQRASDALKEKVRLSQEAIGTRDQLRGTIAQDIARLTDKSIDPGNILEKNFTENFTRLQSAFVTLKSPVASTADIEQANREAAVQAKIIREQMLFDGQGTQDPVAERLLKQLNSLNPPSDQEKAAVDQMKKNLEFYIASRNSDVFTESADSLMQSAKALQVAFQLRNNDANQTPTLLGTIVEKMDNGKLAKNIEEFAAGRDREYQTLKKIDDSGLLQIDSALANIIRQSGVYSSSFDPSDPGLQNTLKNADAAQQNLRNLALTTLPTILERVGIGPIEAGEFLKQFASADGAEFERMTRELIDKLSDPAFRLDIAYTSLANTMDETTKRLGGSQGGLGYSANEAADALNKIPEALKGLAPAGADTALARGGTVPNRPNMRKPLGTDSVLAALTPGEYVLNRSAVDRLGTDYLDMLNRGVVRKAGGGPVTQEELDRYLQFLRTLNAASQQAARRPVNFGQPQNYGQALAMERMRNTGQYAAPAMPAINPAYLAAPDRNVYFRTNQIANSNFLRNQQVNGNFALNQQPNAFVNALQGRTRFTDKQRHIQALQAQQARRQAYLQRAVRPETRARIERDNLRYQQQYFAQFQPAPENKSVGGITPEFAEAARLAAVKQIRYEEIQKARSTGNFALADKISGQLPPEQFGTTRQKDLERDIARLRGSKADPRLLENKERELAKLAPDSAILTATSVSGETQAILAKAKVDKAILEDQQRKAQEQQQAAGKELNRGAKQLEAALQKPQTDASLQKAEAEAKKLVKKGDPTKSPDASGKISNKTAWLNIGTAAGALSLIAGGPLWGTLGYVSAQQGKRTYAGKETTTKDLITDALVGLGATTASSLAWHFGIKPAAHKAKDYITKKATEKFKSIFSKKKSVAPQKSYQQLVDEAMERGKSLGKATVPSDPHAPTIATPPGELPGGKTPVVLGSKGAAEAAKTATNPGIFARLKNIFGKKATSLATNLSDGAWWINKGNSVSPYMNKLDKFTSVVGKNALRATRFLGPLAIGITAMRDKKEAALLATALYSRTGVSALSRVAGRGLAATKMVPGIGLAYAGLSAFNAEKYAQDYTGRKEVTGAEKRRAYEANLLQFLTFGAAGGKSRFDKMQAQAQQGGFDDVTSIRDYFDKSGFATTNALGIGAGVSREEFEKALQEALKKRGKRFADGGTVPNTPNIRPVGTDSVLAALTPGEFVMRKAAVDALGLDFLNRLNRYEGGGAVALENRPSSVPTMLDGNSLNRSYVEGDRYNSIHISGADMDAEVLSTRIINKLDLMSVRGQRTVQTNRPERYRNRDRSY